MEEKGAGLQPPALWHEPEPVCSVLGRNHSDGQMQFPIRRMHLSAAPDMVYSETKIHY